MEKISCLRERRKYSLGLGLDHNLKKIAPLFDFFYNSVVTSFTDWRIKVGSRLFFHHNTCHLRALITIYLVMNF